ncbi:MAG TPA: glycosyltransferase family 2 protein, partial [Actinopolymorphaceae bacterium]|nr:glycosyltransferase family 2 protein [Actinopolymorphaceae bacterium]
DDLLRLAYWESEIAAHASLDDLGWHDGALHLALTADLRADGAPIAFVHRDERDLLDLPVLSEEARALLPDDDLDSTQRLATSKADVLVRSRENGEEHFLTVTSSPRHRPLADDDERFQLVLDAQATLDVTTAAGGSALSDGVWDVVVRVVSCGWRKDVRVGAVRSARADGNCVSAVLGDPARVVTPYWTDMGNLSLDVGQHTSRVRHELSIPAVPEVDAGGSAGITIKVPLRVVASRPVHGAALRLVHEQSGKTVDAPAQLAPAAADGRGSSVLCAQVPEELDPGRWSVEVRLVGSGEGKFIRLKATMTAPADSGAPVFDLPARAGGADLAEESSTKLGPRDRVRATLARRSRWLPVRLRWAAIRAVRRARG